MRIFVSCVNSQQRVTSAEEDFNIQVVRMTCSVGTPSLHFHPAICVALCVLMGRVAMVAGVVYTRAQQHGVPS